MAVRFPHGSSKTVSDLKFIGAWRMLAELLGPKQWNWRRDPMPRSNRAVSLETLVNDDLRFGLDALCRCLVEEPYRNTMHATNPFMEANAHLVTPEQAVNPASGRSVNGARLTNQALELWDRANEDERERVLRETREALQALLINLASETEARSDAITVELAQTTGESPNGGTLLSNALPGPIPEHVGALVLEALRTERMFATCDPVALIQALVEWVAEDTFREVRRRNRLVGEPVIGWPNRLQRYFWDGRDYPETCDYLEPIASEAACLARRLEDAQRWSEAEAERAVQLAQRIFDWGGRSPSDVTPDSVCAVFRNALADEAVCYEAPIGSGWSKVAAFATNHLEAVPDRDPQAIWDSRVSTAVTSRLDRMLVDAGVEDVPREFRDIGPADVGEGGTRPRTLRLEWCNAYGKWRCQLAGSRFVRAIRDVLNKYPRPATEESYPPMPLPDGSTAQWTVRGVEMVLFMDGY